MHGARRAQWALRWFCAGGEKQIPRSHARRRRDDLSYKMRLGAGMTALELADRQTAGTEAARTSREHWATVGPAHW
jgi:hypothetical protein